MEDSDIVDLFWQRSELAIPETDRKYGSYCHTIAYNICGTEEDAEECVSDTWFRAWNAMPQARPARLSAFLGRITRNTAINCLRARNTEKRGSGETAVALEELRECLSGGTDPEQSLEEQELSSAVGCFVASLPETEKKIFILRYWYLEPVTAIAKKLNFSQGKVKSSLFRTRGKLRAYLEGEGLC